MVEKRIPTPEQVQRALAGILASERFQRSRRARELLAYLTGEALAGRGEGVKAYSVAVDVFGKGADFDAENDTLVRVQAGRLRNLLEHYYDSEGRAAEVIFTLPRGGYTLHFTVSDVEPTPVSPPRNRDAGCNFTGCATLVSLALGRGDRAARRGAFCGSGQRLSLQAGFGARSRPPASECHPPAGGRPGDERG